LALGRGLEQDTGARAVTEDGSKPLGHGADPRFAQLAALAPDAELAFLLVHVDANRVHGWPPLHCGVDRDSPCGAAYATTSSGGQPLHPIYVLRSRSRSSRWC